MEVVFLGTSCMQPTKERNHPGILLLYKGEGLLFDCGEGIQRQLKIAGIKPNVITKIFITHWDGDHVLGLPGLLQTMSASDYNRKLGLYGPKGTKKRLELLNNVFESTLGFDLNVKEVKKGKIVEEDGYTVFTELLKHTSVCMGFSFIEKDRRKMNMSKLRKLKIPQGPLFGKLQQGKNIKFKGRTIRSDDVTKLVKGRKIAYATDTRPCDGVLKLAKGADLLVLESTFKSDLEEKARDCFHLTAKEAGLLANQANVKKLVLTHFSQRYKSVQELEEEARDVFDNTQAAEDFMRIRL